jgi:hypothetical protein
MAPKKDPKKDPKGKGREEPEHDGLFVPREPDEPKDVEVEPTPDPDQAQWETLLPVWDAEEVEQEPWNPAETTELFVDGGFDRSALPEDIAKLCAGWKRAPGSSKSAPLDTNAQPEAQSTPGPGMSAFQDLPQSNKCVCTPDEHATGLSELSFDESKAPLVQFLVAQFALVLDQPRLFEPGVLWRRIYPQNEERMPLYNPNGKYIVQLLVLGQWRKVEVDDLVPVVATGGALHPHAPLFPVKHGSGGPGPIWPMILTKALLKAFHGFCARGLFHQIPVVTALTGYIPQRQLLSWANVCEQEEQPLVTLELPTYIPPEDDQNKVQALPIKSEKKKKPV